MLSVWRLRCWHGINLKVAAEREEELGYLGSQNQASGGTNGNKSSEEMKRRSELDAFLDEDAIARGSRGGAGKSDPGLLRGLDWYIGTLDWLFLSTMRCERFTQMKHACMFYFALFSFFMSLFFCLAPSFRYTPSKMAHALARLAADYAAVGDLSNAEALYQHAVGFPFLDLLKRILPWILA